MRKVLAVAVLVLAAQGPAVRAGDSSPFGGTPLFPFVKNSPAAPGMTVRTPYLNTRTGGPASTVTQLQPVVGSIQRTSRFTNPLTHKAKYTRTTHNPALGGLGTQTFRQ
ncbi:hypothetical protein [Frigoriglobus tundricola]|uniref:Secreted protein n=1 Tax=Frigoriglobus tundricola TaxID=2774151 RepID=A0A6M5YRK0_9BACT|nr:hypothetical protein [Frigoriglobus tundricola]QJW95986.1 hypothetical protein FTUN_3540 [Frigoriglobus tundricola]